MGQGARLPRVGFWGWPKMLWCESEQLSASSPCGHEQSRGAEPGTRSWPGRVMWEAGSIVPGRPMAGGQPDARRHWPGLDAQPRLAGAERKREGARARGSSESVSCWQHVRHLSSSPPVPAAVAARQ